MLGHNIPSIGIPDESFGEFACRSSQKVALPRILESRLDGFAASALYSTSLVPDQHACEKQPSKSVIKFSQ